MKKLFRKKAHDVHSALAFALMPGIMLMGIHFFFSFTHFYEWYFWWLDNPMHILGGAVVALAAHILIQEYQRKKKLPKLPPRFTMLVVMGIVALVGIVWEFYEFLSDVAHDTVLQGNMADTMKDFANDLMGGMIMSLIITKKFLKKKK